MIEVNVKQGHLEAYYFCDACQKMLAVLSPQLVLTALEINKSALTMKVKCECGETHIIHFMTFSDEIKSLEDLPMNTPYDESTTNPPYLPLSCLTIK